MYWDHMSGWGWTMMVVWSAVWIGFLVVVGWAMAQWTRRSERDGQPPPQQRAKTADGRKIRCCLGDGSAVSGILGTRCTAQPSG
jgi:hypothetical protein